jgi:hypothetical protein
MRYLDRLLAIEHGPDRHWHVAIEVQSYETPFWLSHRNTVAGGGKSWLL